jgi:hypothetical protein
MIAPCLTTRGRPMHPSPGMGRCWPVVVLLGRRRWWAAAIPPITWLPHDPLYPVAFVAGLVSPIVTARRPERA